ncbi:protein-disulfide reductase DsbD [Pseudaeromonas pectinilytica]
MTSWLTPWLALLLLLIGSGPLLAAQPSAPSPTSSLPASGSATPRLAPANSADDVLNQLGLAPATSQFLPAERAFILSSQQQGNELQIRLEIAPGYYLYRDKLHWQVSEGQLGVVTLPPGDSHDDEFFGRTQVFHYNLDFAIPLQQIPEQARLELSYQGCTEGMCYPPVTQSIPLQPVGSTLKSATSNPQPSNVEDQAAATQNISPLPDADGTPSDRSRAALAQGGWQAVGLFLLLGFGLALTPCMLPMYPILSAIILGRGALSTGRALALSLAYVQGMALTYTLLGLAVASLGAGLQAWLQHPLVLGLFSLLFILLATSMFGAFELQLPGTLQQRLQRLAGAQRSGSLPGVLLMGAISALVCSPCTTAPLSGALLYVAQSGDLWLGALVLYALALGMGWPMLLLGTLGPRWLPKRGIWMHRVKVCFGFVLLAAPLLLLGRWLPEWLIRGGWSLLITTAVGYLLLTLLPSPRLRIAALLLLPLLAVGSWLGLAPATYASLPFTAIQSRSELQQQLQQARAQGQPVMLDLYADWCAACHQLEQETFSHTEVQQQLAHYRLLRVDLSNMDTEQRALLAELQVTGLPAIQFFGQAPDPLARIDGFLDAQGFISRLPQQCQPQNRC